MKICDSTKTQNDIYSKTDIASVIRVLGCLQRQATAYAEIGDHEGQWETLRGVHGLAHIVLCGLASQNHCVPEIAEPIVQHAEIAEIMLEDL